MANTPGVPMMGMNGIPMMGMPGMAMPGMAMMGMPGIPMMGMGASFPMMGYPGMAMMGMPVMPMMGMPGMNVLGAAQVAAQLEQVAAQIASQAPLDTKEATKAAQTASSAQPLPRASTEPRQDEIKPIKPSTTGLDAVNSSAETSKADAEEEQQKPPPSCHLHVKPNAKCKFCLRAVGQTAKSANSKSTPSSESDKNTSRGSSSQKKNSSEDYTRRTFNCSPMLKDQILQSRYFKTLLSSITTLEDLIEEITKYADTLDVYNAGSMTSPSCFICQVYRLFTLPYAEDLGELQTIVDHMNCAEVRCAGFLYMRFVVAPALLCEKFEEYLFDDMELKYSDNGRQVVMTIGNYVEGLLAKDKYFSTPLPRVPVKVRQTLDRELAPLPQFRKRLEANQRTFQDKRIKDLPVEVYIDGAWVSGTAQEPIGRSTVHRRIRVDLDDDGGTVTTHLGKIVLRDVEASEASESGSEGNSGKGRKRKRSRSRSRRRRSPDWSRYKGDTDDHLVEELRERHREEAVFTGRGKFYAKRPQSVEQHLWQNSNPDARVSLLGDFDQPQMQPRFDRHEQGDHGQETKRNTKEDEERNKRMREIYEKYGSASKVSGGSTAASSWNNDMDVPETLRLG